MTYLIPPPYGYKLSFLPLISGFIRDKISGVDYDFKKCYAIGCSGWADFNPPEDEACHIKAQYDYLLFINSENKINVRGQAMRYCWSSRKINDNIQSFLDMAFKPLIDFINDASFIEKSPANFFIPARAFPIRFFFGASLFNCS